MRSLFPETRCYFYPRPPRGGRRICNKSICSTIVFLSTPSARRATVVHGRVLTVYNISIHALREEGDGQGPCIVSPRNYFYPRPPRGGRQQSGEVNPQRLIFLSTPSARRATDPIRQRLQHIPISIHALREEGDLRIASMIGNSFQFLSTPSARRATPSIGRVIRYTRFLSTPSARRATWTKNNSLCVPKISIHALREEGDPSICTRILQIYAISIHALREEGDLMLPGFAVAK